MAPLLADTCRAVLAALFAGALNLAALAPPAAAQPACECGDGVRGCEEECDDGNLESGDGCDANCTRTGCGNAVLTGGEECDDGNLVPNDGCNADCARSHTFATALVVAPGAVDPPGGKFASVTSPLLLAAGRLAFEGATEAILLRSGGQLATVIASGDAVPGGGLFGSLGLPVLNAGGSVAFSAALEGRARRDGIFLWSGGQLSTVAIVGDRAPTGGTLARFRPRIALDSAGQVAFSADAGRLRRIFVWSSGLLRQAAAENDATPCGQVRGIGQSLAAPALGDGGAAAFWAALQRGRAGEGIFTTTADTLRVIACTGDPSPLGGVFSDLGVRPAVNAAGDVAFRARVDLPAPQTDRAGIFVFAPARCGPTGFCTVAVQGDSAPGADGGTFSAFDSGQNPAIAGDDVAFLATVGSGAAAKRAVYLARAGTLERLAGEGDACPLGGTLERLEPEFALRPGGEVVLAAACTGGRGLLRVTAGGSLVPVFAPADVTGAGTGFTGTSPVINDAGAVAFRVERRSVVACSLPACADTAVLAAPLGPAGPPAGEILGVIQAGATASGDGAVAFVAETAGTARRQAVFVARGGTVERIAATGDAAPGTDATFASFVPTPDGVLARPAVGARAAAFLAVLSDDTAGVFRARDGVLAKVMRSGEEFAAGGTVEALTQPGVSEGDVIFGAHASSVDCAFVYREEGVTAALGCTGVPVAAPVGGTMGALQGAPIVGLGQVWIVAAVAGGTSDACLLYPLANDLAEPVACRGDGSLLGGALTLIDPGAGTTGRDVAFLGESTTATRAVYAILGGVRVLVTAELDPEPGPDDGVLSRLGRFAFADGEAVFEADTSGAIRGSGIFRATLTCVPGQCLDGDACNGVETCREGACAAATPPDCDDRDGCTADACVPATGCMHDPITGCTTTTSTSTTSSTTTTTLGCVGTCDDGDPCTADRCVGGTCRSDPRTGLDAVRCVFTDGALETPLCDGETVPAGIGKRFDKAGMLVDKAADGRGRARARRLVRRARGVLGEARGIARRAARKGKIGPLCATGLQARVDGARERARTWLRSG